MFQSFTKKPIIKPVPKCVDSSKRVCLCNVVQYVDDSWEESDSSDDSGSGSSESSSSEMSQDHNLEKKLKVWRVKDTEESRQQRPLFYVDRGRYEKHVFAALTKRGYRQLIYCARSEQYRNRGWSKPEVLRLLKLVWLRNRSGFPAQQLVGKYQYWNHIPNEFELTKKNFLAKNLQNYARSMAGEVSPDKLQIHPETFFLEDPEQLHLFLVALEAAEKSNKSKGADKSKPELFIVKPIDSSGGKGISVVDTFRTFAMEFLTDPVFSKYSLDELRSRLMSGKLKIGRLLIAQRYIVNPLLLDGHKFDIRAYMFVASLDPTPLVFFHDGYLRINIEKYDTTDLSNKWSHISNIGLQKAHPDYEAKKLDTKWSLKTWTKFMLERKMIDDPTFYEKTLKPKIAAITEVAFRSVEKEYMKNKSMGSFALFGIDILIDENWKPWLLEYTKSPAGHSTLEADDTLFADMMNEALSIIMEVDELKQKKQPITELKSVVDFVRVV